MDFKPQQEFSSFDPLDDTVSQISVDEVRDINGGVYDPVDPSSTLFGLSVHSSSKNLNRNAKRSASAAAVPSFEDQYATSPRSKISRSGKPDMTKRKSLPLNALKDYEGAYGAINPSSPMDPEMP